MDRNRRVEVYFSDATWRQMRVMAAIEERPAGALVEDACRVYLRSKSTTAHFPSLSIPE